VTDRHNKFFRRRITMARAISLRSFQNHQAAQDRMIARCFNERRAEAYARKAELAKRQQAPAK
jgi:hypothetical protein